MNVALKSSTDEGNVYNLTSELSDGTTISAGQFTALKGPKGDSGDTIILTSIVFTSSDGLYDFISANYNSIKSISVNASLNMTGMQVILNEETGLSFNKEYSVSKTLSEYQMNPSGAASFLTSDKIYFFVGVQSSSFYLGLDRTIMGISNSGISFQETIISPTLTSEWQLTNTSASNNNVALTIFYYKSNKEEKYV